LEHEFSFWGPAYFQGAMIFSGKSKTPGCFFLYQNKNPEDGSSHLPEDGLDQKMAFCTDPAPLSIVGHVDAPEISLELQEKRRN